MTASFQIGDHVRIHLDSKFGDHQGWHEGTVIKIEPYSQHRSFYWVELDSESQTLLGIKHISVFNPKNIQKVESPA
jgi:hypothetical protein